jgi:long-chain acyl-CoA synthetase
MYLRDHAEETPEKVAVTVAATGESLSYKELDARANRFARLLRRLGLSRGDHIALLMENHARFFEVVAAASRIGLYYTPISSHLTAPEVAYIVDDSAARVVVTTAKLLEVAAAAAPSCRGVEHWFAIGMEDPTAPFEPYEEAVAAEVEDPLGDEFLGMPMMYSSGTTGRPKGVLRPLPEVRPRESDDAIRFGRGLMKFRTGMKLLSVAPLYHAAPHAAVTAALQLGAEVIVMERFDPEECLKLVDRYGITHMQMVPTMFVRLLKLPASVRGYYHLSSLEAVVHSAAPCPIPVKEAMIEWLGPIVYEYYGATESYGFTRCTSEEWLSHKGTVGRAVLGEILILDDLGRAVPGGDVGNVWFVGGSTFRYFTRPKSKRGNRFSASRPEIDTVEAEEAGPASVVPTGAATVGDIGWVDEEGYLYLTDRKSFMIVSGGVNIYPREVEDVLAMHEAVADVAVVGVPDEDFGEQVKAVVMLDPSFSPSASVEQELIGFCRQQLAGFKCPRSVDFVNVLPRLESGKLAKHLVREPYWTGRATVAGAAANSGVEAQ